MPTLALVDGHSMAYRAFFALPDTLMTASGQVTNAAFGFARMLVKLLADQDIDRMAVAWDESRNTFRRDEYPDYKAQRKPTPDTFKAQLPLIREFLDAMGVTQLSRSGFEADDLIGSLARRAEGEGWDVLIVSGDRDTFQLVDDRVTVLYPIRGVSESVVADPAYIEQKYGLAPERYLEFAALRGDTSDNLPGVPGVGEKTASRLLADHGSIDGIYEHLDELTPKLRENLSTHRDAAFRNRHLMRIVTDLEVPSPDGLAWTNWDEDAMTELVDTLEFHSIWEDLKRLHPEIDSHEETIEATVTTATSGGAVLAAAGAAEFVLRPVWDLDDLAGFIVHDDTPTFVGIEFLDALAGRLEDPSVRVVGHHLKPVVRALLELGVALEGISMDTALAAYVLNPATRSFDLRDLASRHLRVELAPEGEGAAEQGTLDFAGGPDLDTAGAEAIAIRRLADAFAEQIDEQGGRDILDRTELPLIPVLAGMEQEGIGVDRAYLEALGDELREELAGLEVAIHAAAGGPFNVNSTQQLREVLFDQLGLPVVKKTSKGVPSTDASVLAKLDHPIVDGLLRYRELEKLRSTYVDGYLPLIGPDGRIHTTFNQMGSATGRLSSDNPNLQNIPIRSESGRTVRRAFIPRPGWRFVLADYSQIELRILAHMSGDPGLTQAFRENLDIHAATAAAVNGVRLDEVTTEMRNRAKAVNFGLLYGMEAFGLADRLEIPRGEAQELIDAYFGRFGSVKAFLGGVVEEAKQRGYTETLFGRRRYLAELRSDNWRVRQMGERMALNAPIQGTAADIIKLAMVAVDQRLRDSEAVMLLQVHDELVVECPEADVDATAALLAETMSAVAQLDVPLVVDTASGADLAAAKG